MRGTHSPLTPDLAEMTRIPDLRFLDLCFSIGTVERREIGWT
jgi:hypothetical protein